MTLHEMVTVTFFVGVAVNVVICLIIRYLLAALTRTEWRLQSCTARIADLEETARTHSKETDYGNI